MNDEERLALELAKARGLDSVRKASDWRGHRVYVPYSSSCEHMCTGLPYVILASDAGVRFSNYEETIARNKELS